MIFLRFASNFTVRHEWTIIIRYSSNAFENRSSLKCVLRHRGNMIWLRVTNISSRMISTFHQYSWYKNQLVSISNLYIKENCIHHQLCLLEKKVPSSTYKVHRHWEKNILIFFGPYLSPTSTTSHLASHHSQFVSLVMCSV